MKIDEIQALSLLSTQSRRYSNSLIFKVEEDMLSPIQPITGKISFKQMLDRYSKHMEYRKIESDGDINTLVQIAHEIWSRHFKSMFDCETLPKLIEGAQSKKAILSQIEDGYQYFFIIEGEKKIGYFAYKINKPSDEMFLSKIYIYSDQRGKGAGKKVLNHLEKLCHDAGRRKISLTVYHENTNSIKAYEKWGFTNLGLIKRQFDNGLIFEDIKMEKSI